MKKLVILTALAALTSTSIGCHGHGGGCFGRRNQCPPYEPIDQCDPCAEGAVGAPILSAPGPGPMILPGPAASNARNLSR